MHTELISVLSVTSVALSLVSNLSDRKGTKVKKLFDKIQSDRLSNFLMHDRPHMRLILHFVLLF